MTIEPLRSATTIERVEETSLALPSDNTLRSGQQRVLDQVHTIKRSRSKKSGSLSPTSPQKISEFRSFKFVPTTLNGSIYSRSNSAGTSSGHMKMTSHSIQTRSLSTKSLGRRQVSHASQIEQRFLPISPTAMEVPVLKQSNSDPELDVGAKVMQQAKSRTLRSMSTRVGQPSFQTITNGSTHYYQTHVPNQAPLANQTQLAGQTHILRPPSNHSSREAKTSFKTKEAVIAFNDVGSIPDITMKEAVEYLSSTDQAYQLRGASYIQHTTFKEDMAKQEVFQLNGIPLLVAHLRSPNSQIQQTAAAALRNLVFRHAANKQEVQQCGGIGEALALLRDTESTETQKQLSGLLWNLSSADELKPELINSALPVLTESIVIPFTCWSDSSAMNNVDSEVFYNATGCLRNLSCAKEAERKAMRDCRGLIDSLISYIQSCVSEDNPDDKSVENCTCILHNLTYQVEVEAPEHFSKITALSQPPSRSTATKEASPVSCFSPKSSKINRENVFNYPLVEESDPKGTEWLFHSKTLQTYLALMGNSMKDPTLEACAGALQNLTANKGIVSSVMSQTIVQKLNGLPEIIPLLQSSTPSVQKTAVSLVGNLSRTPSLQSTLAREVLPHLAAIISTGENAKRSADDTLTTACNTFHSLLKVEPELARRVVNDTLVNSLSYLSSNGALPKSGKAASLLLYGLWGEKEIQSILKKRGMTKSTFVNDITTSAHKDAQTEWNSSS